MRLVASTGCALIVCSWSVCARAEPRGAPFALEYSVPDGCPERLAFVGSLVARARGAYEHAVAPRVTLSVAISGTAESASGALVARLADGQESRREIPEARCSEVLSSMTVIAAMILDGGGLDDPAPIPSSAEPAGSAALVPHAYAARWRPPRGTATERAEREHSAPSRTRLAATAGLGPQSGVAPSLVPRWYAGLGLVFDPAAALSPSVDVSGSVAEGSSEVDGYGDARFRLLALTLTGCPLRWALSARFAVRPCLPVELGVLRGVGDNTVRARTQRMPWAGAGAALRAELSLSRAVLLELEARGTALARADRFVFEPDRVAHDVPRFVFGLRAAVVARVP